jgi:ABC-type glycerol-3-phosphate transport system substrate-binding protein
MAGRSKSLYRRDFLKGASGGVAALLAARSAAAQTPEAAPAASSAGKTIRVLVVGDPFQFALDKIKGEFTAQTGINVEMRNSPTTSSMPGWRHRSSVELLTPM